MAVKIGIIFLGGSLFRKYMYSKYKYSLLHSGAEVKVLPWVKSPEEAERELEGCDGLLMPGGKDVNPALYNEEKLPCCGEQAPERDICEPLYFKAAREKGLPVLGICRGLQIINVIMGGSLWQDTGLMPGEHINHSAFKKRRQHVHDVSIAPGSLLDGPCEALQGVNTMHHQCIKTPAKGLVPIAESTDGIIEAFQGSEGAFLLAVQWHPEHLFKKDEAARKIFRLFIDAAKE